MGKQRKELKSYLRLFKNRFNGNTIGVIAYKFVWLTAHGGTLPASLRQSIGRTVREMTDDITNVRSGAAPPEPAAP